MNKPTPALVISLIALFVALGGTGYAALKITGKSVKNRTLTGKDVKKNSLRGSEIREPSLAKVPRAAHADAADQADSAGNAATVGGQAPAAFAPASRFFQGYATAARGQTAPIVSRGPFVVELFCAPSAVDQRAARLQVTVAETHRTSTTMLTETNASADQAAGTVHNVGQTIAVPPGSPAYRALGAYFDVSGGRSLDVAARLRVGHLGAPDCSAHVTATFNGL